MYSWDRMPDALKDQVFSHLNKLAAVANLSEADRIAYDKALDRFYVNRIVEHDIREEGRAEGRMEEKYEVVRNSRKLGLSVEAISKLTGLSVEEIKRL